MFPGNSATRLWQNLTAVIILSNIDNGFPLAFLEGTLCSNIRAAAVSATAADYLALKDSHSIGFIGAGEQAKMHFVAMKAVRPQIKICKIASRTEQTVQIFIKELKQLYPDVKFISCGNNYPSAVKDTNIIVTAISAQERILKAEWITPGTFYCHVAGVEDENDVALKADKIVCDNWDAVKHRSQTIALLYKEGILKDSDIYANLDKLISGEKLGRTSDDEFIYFNAVGLSFVDIALAASFLSKAEKNGIGKLLQLQQTTIFDRPLSWSNDKKTVVEKEET